MITLTIEETVIPETHPEIRTLLLDGWEPFGVHKIAIDNEWREDLVRIYFRRKE